MFAVTDINSVQCAYNGTLYGRKSVQRTRRTRECIWTRRKRVLLRTPWYW